MHKRRMKMLAAVCVLLCVCQRAVAQWTHMGDVTDVSHDEHTITVTANQAKLHIQAVSEHIVRVRLAQDGTFGRDFSWAVLDLDPKGKFVSFEDSPDVIRTSTGALTVEIRKSPCRIRVVNHEGHMLVSDEPARGMGWQPASKSEQSQDNVAPPAPVRVWHELPDGISVFGLGEKTGPLNKRGRQWTMWNTDAYGYGPSRDPIYKSIPFYMASWGSRFWGVFLDNPWRSSFDIDHGERNVLSMGAEGGELNYYVIDGPTPKKVVERFTELTGRMDLPPKWTLGYHQCRYSYYPDARVRELANTFRDKRIPCDVLYFDIDYMDGYRCFTWSDRWFPDPKGLMDDLHAQGFHTVAIIDPAIKFEPGYPVYDSGTQRDVWTKKPDGETYVGAVWPGKAVFPDFTKPDVRDWWADLYVPFMRESGLDGIWNDMNEPADFAGPNHSVPLDLVHDNEGEPASHRACHNIYGMQMVRATEEGLKRANPDKRPFAITRATYAGGQRYSATWTGDNTSNWEHLRMSIPMALNMGLSGFANVGPDIGGFAGGATPELYARWIQAGSLFPFCRTHTAWGNPDQEPWSFGQEVEAIARTSIERRYMLLPYLYTLFEECSRTGVPVMRPLWMEFPDMGGWDASSAFMLGPHLYVSPIMHAGAMDFFHWLPGGTWFDMGTGLLHRGGQAMRIKAGLDHLPLFVRAGAIIPTQSVVQSTEETPKEPLIIDVWPHGESFGELYEDDGKTISYESGAYRRTRFRCNETGDRIEVSIGKPEGSYVPPDRSPLVRLHGLRSDIAGVRIQSAGDEPVSTDKPTAADSVDAPGRFARLDEQGGWIVRMMPDKGQAQQLTVRLSPPPALDDSPVQFSFDDNTDDVLFQRDFVEPTIENGALKLIVHADWEPHIVFQRRAIPADKLTRMKIRVSTEHTRKLALRFATLADDADHHEFLFDVTPDGEIHEYTFNLPQVTAGKWTGTVFFLRLDLKDSIMPAEIVRLDDLRIERG